jgi:hypothetical protein
MYGALNDPYFVLSVLSCYAVITIGSIVTAVSRVPGVEFARLQSELKELSGRVSALEAVEQRRLLRELNSRAYSEGAEATYTTNRSGQLEAEGEAPVISISRDMGRKRRIKMFGKAKGSAHEKDEHLPPAPQLKI